MRNMKRDILMITIGFSLFGAAWWGVNAYKTYVIYHEDTGGSNRVPDPVAIERFGHSITPDLCMAISDEWKWDQSPQLGGSGLIMWARVLGDLRDDRAVPTLIALTDHRNPQVRLHAVLSLSRFHDPRSVPALKRMVHDPHHRVAEEACSSLSAQQQR
jgi:hypothetical protein